MALDTASKRYSSVAVSLPWRGFGYFPTGTVNGVERQAIAYLYSGISASSVIPPSFTGFIANIRLPKNTGIYTFNLADQFDDTILYAIAPILPAGMSLDVNTGVLTIDTDIAALGITGPYTVAGS